MPPPAPSRRSSPMSNTSVPQDDVWKVDCEFSGAEAAFVPWNTEPFAVRRSSKNFLKKYEKMGSTLTNSQAVLPLLQRASRCKEKFRVGAYVHQYEAHGVGKEEFEQSFLAVDQIVAGYSGLSAARINNAPIK